MLGTCLIKMFIKWFVMTRSNFEIVGLVDSNHLVVVLLRGMNAAEWIPKPSAPQDRMLRRSLVRFTSVFSLTEGSIVGKKGKTFVAKDEVVS